MIEPGLYVGDVMHRRLRPRPHRFRYRAFWIALDLDRLEQNSAGLRFLSLDRFNLFGFHERDHADGCGGRLVAKMRALVARSGFDAEGRMTLLTMPRVCGYVFNPLSVYFCHDARGEPSAVVWEVSNTFGARHSYVIGVDDPKAPTLRQFARKELHVSPFIGMDIRYSFRVTRDGDALTIGIVDHDSDGPLLTAALAVRRRALTDGALWAAFVRIPVVTLKVALAIHWEALRLWLKGARFRRTPPGRDQSVGVLSASAAGEKSCRKNRRAV